MGKDNYCQKSYVEKLYPIGVHPTGMPITVEVKERDPYSIEDDGSIVGFRFYDEESWFRSSSDWCISTYNHSGWVFFGKRYTYEELFDICKNMSLKDRLNEFKMSFYFIPTSRDILEYMRTNNLSTICIDRFHLYHEMDEKDMTYDELMEQKRNKK